MIADLLEQISNVAISLGEQDFPDQVMQSNWLGYEPATELQILMAEERLSISLPDDYKEFLRVTNGFLSPRDSTEPTFDAIEKVGYLKDLDSQLIEIWSGHESLDDISQQLKKSIRIGSNEQLFLIIPPSEEDRSWNYWKFASWIPGEDEYEGLNDYFKEVLIFLEN